MARRLVEGGDGRVGRMARSRQALCDAFLALVQEGHLRPTADEIAARAGLSRRSLFHHFRELGELYDAAYEIGMQRSDPLMRKVDPRLPVDEKIEQLVENRCQFLEVTLPFTWELTARALVGPAQEQARRSALEKLTEQNEAIAQLFGGDLAHLTTAERVEVSRALAAAISPPIWGYFRNSLELSYKASRNAVTRSLRALLRDAGVAVG